MSIYKTVLEFSDGRTFEDLWPEKADALSYIENAPAYDGCTRAELWEWHPEGVTFKPYKCIYEYAIDGNYLFNVEEVNA